MAYTKQTWTDLPSETTPINSSRLTHIENGIFDAAKDADDALEGLATKQSVLEVDQDGYIIL